MVITRNEILHWLETSAAILAKNKALLTQLDAAIGDADHGINMVRGFNKVQEKLPSLADEDIGNILQTTAMTLIASVGGASGPLYGIFFLRSGMAIGDRMTLSGEDLYRLLKTGIDGVVQRGRAQQDDKTMIDAWLPALDALRASLDESDDATIAVRAAAQAAKRGMEDTIPLRARKGRASYLGERSVGHQDPGATSTYLLLRALQQTLER